MAKTTCFLSSSVLVVVGSFSLNPKGKSFQRMTRCNPAPERLGRFRWNRFSQEEKVLSIGEKHAFSG
jgi:hypothetical protein